MRLQVRSFWAACTDGGAFPHCWKARTIWSAEKTHTPLPHLINLCIFGSGAAEPVYNQTHVLVFPRERTTRRLKRAGVPSRGPMCPGRRNTVTTMCKGGPAIMHHRLSYDRLPRWPY